MTGGITGKPWRIPAPETMQNGLTESIEFFPEWGCKSLDMDYKSLFTKNLKIMSFTFWLQNYEKNSEKPNSF